MAEDGHAADGAADAAAPPAGRSVPTVVAAAEASWSSGFTENPARLRAWSTTLEQCRPRPSEFGSMRVQSVCFASSSSRTRMRPPPCSRHSSCANVAGGYECACESAGGWAGPGEVCGEAWTAHDSGCVSRGRVCH